jgi:hypothetical protein
MDLPNLIKSKYCTKEVEFTINNNQLEELAKLAKLALANSTSSSRSQVRSGDVANANHANAANRLTPPIKEQPSPNLPTGRPCTGSYDGRHITEHRRIMFESRRIPSVEASRLAARLFDRDQDLDDRKMCIECAQLVGNYCHSERAPVGGGRTVLHRCIDFMEDSND